MCYQTKLNSRLSDIEKTFGARFVDPEAYQPLEEINAYAFNKTPVITDGNKGEIQMFNWGLIPFWAKSDSIKKTTLNVRIETATENPRLEIRLRTVASQLQMDTMNGNG